MQDKTINNALLALYSTGDAREHVEALKWYRAGLIGHGACTTGRYRVVSAGGSCWNCFRAQPQTLLTTQAELVGVSRKSAVQRAYMALCRLRDSEHVVQGFGSDGCLWQLAQ